MTAVEWLISELNHCKEDSGFIEITPNLLNNILGQQALEMEKQQMEIFDERLTFEQELQKIINKHSMENASNTPDFILARFMYECLKSFSNAVNYREQLKQRKVK